MYMCTKMLVCVKLCIWIFFVELVGSVYEIHLPCLCVDLLPSLCFRLCLSVLCWPSVCHGRVTDSSGYDTLQPWSPSFHFDIEIICLLSIGGAKGEREKTEFHVVEFRIDERIPCLIVECSCVKQISPCEDDASPQKMCALCFLIFHDWT